MVMRFIFIHFEHFYFSLFFYSPAVSVLCQPIFKCCFCSCARTCVSEYIIRLSASLSHCGGCGCLHFCHHSFWRHFDFSFWFHLTCCRPNESFPIAVGWHRIRGEIGCVNESFAFDTFVLVEWRQISCKAIRKRSFHCIACQAESKWWVFFAHFWPGIRWTNNCNCVLVMFWVSRTFQLDMLLCRVSAYIPSIVFSFISQAIFAIENSGRAIADGATWECDRMHAHSTAAVRAIFPSINEFGYCEFRLLPPSINNIGCSNTHSESKLWQQPAAGKLHTMTWRTFEKKK